MNWLAMFMLALLVAGTYWQAIQGLTSAAIMAVLTALSVALSFGTYDFVAQKLLAVGQVSDYAHALALFGTFIIPLGLLRVAVDTWVPRSSLLPQIIDRGGAAAFGLGSSFLTAGMLVLAIQMVPWGTTGFLGFQRFDPSLPGEQRDLWLKPDRVAASFGSSLSSGVFSGERPFAMSHPDLVTEIGWTQFLPRGVRRGLPADAIRVQDASLVDYVHEKSGRTSDDRDMKYTEIRATGGNVLLSVTVELLDGAKDTDGQHRFTLPCLRLLGQRDKTPEAYRAVAIADPRSENRYIRSTKVNTPEKVDMATQVLSPPAGKSTIDVVFEHPKGFVPEFVAYKLGAVGRMCKIRQRAGGFAPGGPTDGTQAAVPPPGPTPAAPNSGGRTSGVKVRAAGSHFGGDLPVAMTAFTGDNEIEGGFLVEGHVSGKVDDQGTAAAGRPSFTQLKVPSGKALLQLNVNSVRAGSTLGQALNFSVQSVENYVLSDDRGNSLTPIGKYAVALVGGEEIIEIQYFPELGASGARSIRPFARITNQHLTGDYQLVYLFLMETGAKAVKFSTGGTQGGVDLTAQNLVAR